MSAGIAVIGLAGRFPGAVDVDRFWANLCAGVESITFFSADELLAAGVDPTELADPRYVRAAPILDDLRDIGGFDAAFFGYPPREARLMDPQQRIFLECAWSALEHAGYDPHGFDGAIGVYAGSAMNTYLLATSVARHLRDDLLTLLGNDKDFLTTRVSYQLGLTGPSVGVQTACSTSLVAVHLACQGLLDGECDMALAGGIAVRVPQRAGYRYVPGGVLSPDGHCRAFDARARGTLFGSGVGVVVLKRLDDALADRDHVHAVVKGSAVNNDGSAKADYTAPSLGGQAEVIVEALAHAGVDAGTVGYVEAHGTGTALGDPIEVAALTRAFRRTTGDCGCCALGSVKTNIGHLDAAAGVAGLIKTVLALRHGLIPPSLHFTEPNPEINFPRTPFYVNTALAPWPDAGGPRRAGVSSLGIGGTNAHVVLEQAPPLPPADPSRPDRLVVLSARTPEALDAATANLRGHLAAADTDLADVAYTLQVGRQAFAYRRMLVSGDSATAAEALARPRSAPVVTARTAAARRSVVFMFPGGGMRYAPLGPDLYATEPVFRDRVERGLRELRAWSDADFRRLVFGDGAGFDRPAIQLPALFLFEEAMARLWMSWGVRPSALIGHSMGELTAACLAGVFGFTEALGLVVTRGRLIESVRGGATLGVGLSERELVPLLGDGLDLAAVNAPGACAVSGPAGPVGELAARLTAHGVRVARLPIATAAHSRLLDPLQHRFEQHVRELAPRPPQIPFISNVTGHWITKAQATDPAYWAAQLRSTVRFADGVRELAADQARAFLDVGPGQTLAELVRAHPGRPADQPVIASMPHPHRQSPQPAAVLDALGRLWLAGVDVNWTGFSAAERRCRVPLPAYPFEDRRYWIDDPPEHLEAAPRDPAADGPARVAPWTALEREVAGIWHDVLGRDLSIHDDFFELGGTSLLLTEIVARVNRAYGLELAPLTLVESPTVAELAERIAAARAPGRTTSNAASAPPPPGSTPGPLAGRGGRPTES